MKKRSLQIGSFLMALAVLFVSVGWHVKFHYCTEDHRMTGSFGDAAAECVHCLGHHHEHEAEAVLPHDVIQFNEKCCCDDFDSEIQFTDNYVFSLNKHLIVSPQSFVLPHFDFTELCTQESTVFSNHSPRKTLLFLSGRARLVCFSHLKLNPLVF